MAVTTRIDIVGVVGSPYTNHGEGGIGWVSDGLVSLLRVPSRSGDLFGQIPLSFFGHPEGLVNEAHHFLAYSRWCSYHCA